MCGRYSLATPGPDELRARFGLRDDVVVPHRYNVAPTDGVLAVTTDRDGQPRGETLHWGLVPPWSKSPAGAAKMINARAETLADKPAYRGAFQRFRCLIPADGFYEWRRAGARREAFHITRTDGAPFAFAGLWSVWHRGEPDELRSCTIVTTAANARIAELHDRMPAILQPRAEATWLDPDAPPEALLGLLGGLSAEDVALRAVGPAVNSVRNDGPECLAAPAPTLL